MSEPTTVPVADRLHQMDHMLREVESLVDVAGLSVGWAKQRPSAPQAPEHLEHADAAAQDARTALGHVRGILDGLLREHGPLVEPDPSEF
jgi:hypothetical protein